MAPENQQQPVYQPPSPPQYWELGQAQPPQWPQDEPFCCDFCGDVIEPGEPCIELFYGKAGVGEKSGKPMVVESHLVDFPTVNLHEWCVGDFGRTFIYDSGEPDGPQFCAGCEAKLSGD